MYCAVACEDRNKPAVTLANHGFANDARSAASGKGMPSLRIIPTTVPCESSVEEDIDAGISSVFGDIIAALTRPLNSEESAPQLPAPEKPTRIIFRGDLKEVNRFFYRRGWSDGFPIVPPTEEEVAEMLKGTDLPPDHIVADIIPRSGKATVEKIAVNAVMAGALPTYLPLLIAGVKILADPTSGFGGWGVSTGSWSPFWLLNGPVRKELNINSGSGALSPGDIANAAIGRAMGLIIKNIGGARKGVEDMGTQGHPGKYTMVIAENEEESPWEPFHVEHGYQKEDSTISVFSPNTYIQTWPYGSDDEGIMRALIDNILPKGGLCIVLTPPHARNLFREGWKKGDIKVFLAENARTQPYRLPSYWGTSSPLFDGARPGLWGKRVPVRDSDSVPILMGAESVHIIVGGGPGAMIGMHMGGSFFSSQKMTEKIELPANWSQLVQQYKNLVPNYVRY
ncbi:MAG: hypothetical protein JXA46_08770 [Dehalococcoidales bacterium]|nr:hypothetical protein [Dehalococcoidales bacterium]